MRRLHHAAAAATLLNIAWSSQALAGGGAHVIDDVDVETPGTCHLETWVTDYGNGSWLLNLGPACTSGRLPNLEFGAGVAYNWTASSRHTIAGPAIKLNLRSAEQGLGLSIIMSGGWSFRNERLESAGIIAPLTIDLDPNTRVNVNGGWIWSRTGDHSAAFAGVQVERQLGPTLALMGEVFGRDRGPVGMQGGVRWTPVGWVDVDLLAGRKVDGVSPRIITVGITVRR